MIFWIWSLQKREDVHQWLVLFFIWSILYLKMRYNRPFLGVKNGNATHATGNIGFLLGRLDQGAKFGAYS